MEDSFFLEHDSLVEDLQFIQTQLTGDHPSLTEIGQAESSTENEHSFTRVLSKY